MPAACFLTSILVALPEPRPNLNYVEWDEHGIADAGFGRQARLYQDLLTPEENDAFTRAVSGFKADTKKLDSIDAMPAYEIYLRERGKDNNDLPTAAAMLRALEERMRPILRGAYNCASCSMCGVLLRRYRASERLKVPNHFDRMAVVTAVASLNPSEFAGGLYLQRTPRAESREYFSSGNSSGRDVIFHSYDLNHGVHVHNGTRASIVFWYTDTDESCRDDVSPWYRAPAEAGSRDAQEALAELHQLGQHGYERSAPAAAAWAEKAAEQGSATAAHRLGRMLLAGEGIPRDAARGCDGHVTAAWQLVECPARASASRKAGWRA